MQAIIDSLPDHVLNYSYGGKTILDHDFLPFWCTSICKNVQDLKEGELFTVIRPHYIMEDVEYQGKKVIKEYIEGNIQDAIDHKVDHILVANDPRYYYLNSFEDDVYRLLDAGNIRALYIDKPLKSNGKQYHVDFMCNQDIGDNFTSYYSYGRETAKTVSLRNPIGPITNNLITLGSKWNKPAVYPDTITSKFIGSTNYTNVFNRQDILNTLKALKAKIEAL